MLKKEKAELAINVTKHNEDTSFRLKKAKALIAEIKSAKKHIRQMSSKLYEQKTAEWDFILGQLEFAHHAGRSEIHNNNMRIKLLELAVDYCAKSTMQLFAERAELEKEKSELISPSELDE